MKRKYTATIRMGAAHDDLILHLKAQDIHFGMNDWGTHKRQRIGREVLKDAKNQNPEFVRTRAALSSGRAHASA